MSGANQNYLIAVGPFNKFYFYDGNSWLPKVEKLKSYDEYMVLGRVWQMVLKHLLWENLISVDMHLYGMANN
ncbi:MAG: hypothetical protein M0P71_09100 [Melioribacteraceae bacterium]|nr:hypothetical protein [Melioribacteraceae bacterium]